MAKLLYAWEFGNALGHMGAFLPLARALVARNHDVRFSLAQVDAAATLLHPHGFRWVQSPNVTERHRPTPPLSYADMLLRLGYDHPDRLMGLVVAWRELLQLAGTQLVLPDHAPTAILAARTLGIPVLTYSYGFCVPPPLAPTPNMRPWLAIPTEQLGKVDGVVLASINTVLENFSLAPLRCIADLFAVAEPALMTFPELDHYLHCRGTAAYWGCLLSSISGTPPVWPPQGKPRIFAYLRREVRHADALLAALGQSGYPSLVVFPDIAQDMLARHAYANLRISRTPLETTALMQETDVAITYGGHGLTAAFLLAGKPLLLLPGHLEQFLLARQVEQMGAGLLVDPEKPATDLPDRLRRLATDRRFAANAGAFAQKYAAFTQEKIAANLVRRIEEICS